MSDRCQNYREVNHPSRDYIGAAGRSLFTKSKSMFGRNSNRWLLVSTVCRSHSRHARRTYL